MKWEEGWAATLENMGRICSLTKHLFASSSLKTVAQTCRIAQHGSTSKARGIWVDVPAVLQWLQFCITLASVHSTATVGGCKQSTQVRRTAGGGGPPVSDECIGTADSVLLLFSPVIRNIKRSLVFPVTLLQPMSAKFESPKDSPTAGRAEEL